SGGDVSGPGVLTIAGRDPGVATCVGGSTTRVVAWSHARTVASIELGGSGDSARTAGGIAEDISPPGEPGATVVCAVAGTGPGVPAARAAGLSIAGAARSSLASLFISSKVRAGGDCAPTGLMKGVPGEGERGGTDRACIGEGSRPSMSGSMDG